jgi:hypothetical protein
LQTGGRRAREEHRWPGFSSGPWSWLAACGPVGHLIKAAGEAAKLGFSGSARELREQQHVGDLLVGLATSAEPRSDAVARAR